ncbi:MAG: hypothetical protein MJ252_30370 [archaeon]|nr:hypothetical protein [archaeon]
MNSFHFYFDFYLKHFFSELLLALLRKHFFSKNNFIYFTFSVILLSKLLLPLELETVVFVFDNCFLLPSSFTLFVILYLFLSILQLYQGKLFLSLVDEVIPNLLGTFCKGLFLDLFC